ncbi:MAG: hypothetical protein JXA03_04870 [Bacteroidales bacterium]|nr:hypothetical protein [Bacteroidales bacterium]
MLLAILRGEFNINGFRNKNLQKLLGFNGGKISRLIKRLRVHGLIKKATDSYKYYLTKIGKETIIMAQKIKDWCWFQHIAIEYYAKKYINLKDKVLNPLSSQVHAHCLD